MKQLSSVERTLADGIDQAAMLAQVARWCAINTGTRNDPGRLGTREGNVYLASPLTVAASAVAGAIADPRKYL